jgi:hypothetical protein
LYSSCSNFCLLSFSIYVYVFIFILFLACVSLYFFRLIFHFLFLSPIISFCFPIFCSPYPASCFSYFTHSSFSFFTLLFSSAFSSPCRPNNTSHVLVISFSYLECRLSLLAFDVWKESVSYSGGKTLINKPIN